MLFALVFGLPLGIVAALKSGKWADHAARLISLLGASTPPFWSGLVGLFLLYYVLQVLPGPSRIDTRTVAPENITGLYLIDTLLRGDLEGFVDVRCDRRWLPGRLHPKID